jgi:hypothetical protein
MADHEDGTWTITVPAGPAFAHNAALALTMAGIDRSPGSSRSALERIARALVDATYQRRPADVDGAVVHAVGCDDPDCAGACDG